MIAVNRRLCLFALIMAAAPLQVAWPQTSGIQGAWIEEGTPCASVFVPTKNAVDFKRPASAFAPAFIIAPRRLSTPLANCRVVGVIPSGERKIVRLRCTTSIATDSARVILAPSNDGGLYRFNAVDGGITSRYRLCNRDALKSP